MQMAERSLILCARPSSLISSTSTEAGPLVMSVLPLRLAQRSLGNRAEIDSNRNSAQEMNAPGSDNHKVDGVGFRGLVAADVDGFHGDGFSGLCVLRVSVVILTEAPGASPVFLLTFSTDISLTHQRHKYCFTARESPQCGTLMLNPTPVSEFLVFETSTAQTINFSIIHANNTHKASYRNGW